MAKHPIPINMASIPYSLRLSDEQKDRIEVVAKKLALPLPDVMRLAIDIGLPELVKRLQTPSAPTDGARR